MTKARTYSAIATAVISAGVVAWMMLDTITLSHDIKEWPPRHDSEIVIDDTYAEIFDLPMYKTAADADPAPAFNDVDANNDASIAPESGMETVDQGAPADAPTTVTQTKPSPVKIEKKEKPVRQGPSAEEIERQKAEEARRKASQQTRNAFANAGKNNATNPGKEPGNAGSPSGTASAINGNSTGRAGGGWLLPAYRSVPSSVTGSVEMTVKVDKQGRVTSVTFTGGDAPAATNPAVRAACEQEVRNRRLTRNDDNAPDESTAYITYRFR